MKLRMLLLGVVLSLVSTASLASLKGEKPSGLADARETAEFRDQVCSQVWICSKDGTHCYTALRCRYI